MAKVSEQARKRYQEKIKEFKSEISNVVQNEKKILAEVKKGDLVANQERLTLADMNLVLVSYHALINSLSLSLLGVKNDNMLNEGRKCLYKTIIYLEEIVSAFVDVPFGDYQEGLDSIESFDDSSRCNLIKKIGFAISVVQDGFGENSKWKWSFVELGGRYATVAKNMINFLEHCQLHVNKTA